MSESQTLLERARRHIPGGVNSPVRAFAAVGGTPPFIASAEGACLTDEDGRTYIDYVGSWGPMILGHRHPKVVAALTAQLARGTSFGAPTRLEVELAELVCARVPSIESLRMVNSGTEATMSALRLARGVTGRDCIIKFDGCYHGHADALLVAAGSGALTFGVPNSPGVPADTARHTLTLPYNDVAAAQALFAERGAEIAAVIVEPVAGNMNCIPPLPAFLPALRELCTANGSLLIFDEVMTGFRVGPGGAQALYGVRPDLTTLGKIIGGGLPVGAFGGRRDIMEQLAPVGPVYQAGTLSGNPLAMAAGLATLQELDQPGVYARLERSTTSLLHGMRGAAESHGVALTTTQVGSMFGLFLGLSATPTRLEEVAGADLQLFKRFFHGMLRRDVYLAPSAFEAGFVSAAHSPTQIEQTVAAAGACFSELGA